MRKNIIETVMGALVLAVAAVFVVTAFKSTTAGKVDGNELRMELADASGVVRGTDVRMAGVKIGTVVDQTLDRETFFASVVMEIDDAIALPIDSKARVLPDGLLGGIYINLEAGSSEETIPAGGEITDSRGPVNVVDLIGKAIFLAVDKAQEKE
jgi:phospholipid/cholesterol/gamma-HCH transport system substrate-binding protein